MFSLMVCRFTINKLWGYFNYFLVLFWRVVWFTLVESRYFQYLVPNNLKPSRLEKIKIFLKCRRKKPARGLISLGHKNLPRIYRAGEGDLTQGEMEGRGTKVGSAEFLESNDDCHAVVAGIGQV